MISPGSRVSLEHCVRPNSVKQMMNKLDSLQQMLYFAWHTAVVKRHMPGGWA
jgi:hypothetical protein